MKKNIAKVFAMALLVAGLTVPFSPAVAAQPQYTITTIDIPEASATFIWGINEDCDVVGFYRDGSFAAHGYSMIDGVFNSFDYAGMNSTLISINGKGEIVGDYTPPDSLPTEYHWHAYEIAKNGTAASIDDSDHDTTVPIHIMADGTVIGFVQEDVTDNWTRHGMIQYPNGSVDYSTIPYSQHNDATPNGKIIVGNYVTQEPGGLEVIHGYVLQDGIMTTLDAPWSTDFTLTYDIDPTGKTVAGWYKDSFGLYHGYTATRKNLKDNDWKYTQFNIPGALFTMLTSANNNGCLAGGYFAGGKMHGFIATPIDN